MLTDGTLQKWSDGSRLKGGLDNSCVQELISEIRRLRTQQRTECSCASLRTENEMLRSALEFYANGYDANNYGETARKALGEKTR